MKSLALVCFVYFIKLGELKTAVNFIHAESVLGVLLESAVTAVLCEAVGLRMLICVE